MKCFCVSVRGRVKNRLQAGSYKWRVIVMVVSAFQLFSLSVFPVQFPPTREVSRAFSSKAAMTASSPVRPWPWARSMQASMRL